MLSNGAINNLLRISSTNVLDTIVDFNLQIISLNLQSKQNNIKRDFDLYTCALSDTKYSYYGFILPVNKEKLNPKIGDIIKVSKISTSKLTYNGCKIIIVKSYDILRSSVEIKTNLIQVESYQDIQNKIEEENKKQKKLEENNNKNSQLLTEKEKEEKKIEEKKKEIVKPKEPEKKVEKKMDDELEEEEEEYGFDEFEDDDLNKLDDSALKKKKAEMDVEFEKNNIKKGDAKFQYDIRKEFDHEQYAAEWDDDSY